MRRKSGNSSSVSKQSSGNEAVDLSEVKQRVDSSRSGESSKRPGFLWIGLLVLILYCSWSVHHYQFETLPRPLSHVEAGKRGFSEDNAMEHVKMLTEFGPHPVGSDALDLAVKYVLAAAENIKDTAHTDVNVEVDFFHAESGSNNLSTGRFKGKTLVYSDLKHVVLRFTPKSSSEVAENAILVSSHIDTVYSAVGAGDCSSCISVMLELARGVSQWAHGFKNAVIFLFNTGEEEGLNGAHSFITQHPWSSSIRLAVDLEAMGIGGPSSIFQAGPHPWAIETYAKVAKYPSGQIISQDLFASGVINSATDFQIYKEVAGLSGLDFAYTDLGAVYHTKNDRLKFLKPGSLQHLGENMLAFLIESATSSHLPKGEATETDKDAGEKQAIFFDILGSYMIVYRQPFATMLQNSILLPSILIWSASLFMGGYTDIISMGLSLLSLLLMWIFSLGLSLFVAFLIPLIHSSPAAYIANPWVVIGLFMSPAILGALSGQHIGYLLLLKHLDSIFPKREQISSVGRADLIKFEAERWLFKSGFLQWLLMLIAGTYFKIGCSYIALLWLVSPAFAYGFLEATLTQTQSRKPLKIETLLLGSTLPILITAGVFIRITGTLTGMVVRLETNPGSTPEWLGNVMVAGFIAAVVCLTLVYLFSYFHLSDSKRSIFLATTTLFGLTLAAVLVGIVPPFSEDISRALNVVHVVETSTGTNGQIQPPTSYISLSSLTPGKLTEELKHFEGEGFVCGKEKVVDFVTFKVNYGCWSSDDSESGWNELEIPTLSVTSDIKEADRVTRVSIDTKVAVRWALAINTDEIEGFKLEVTSEELVPVGDKPGVNGWHIIQFAGGKMSPTKFDLTLFWMKNSTSQRDEKNQDLLLRMRTDVNRLTPKSERVLRKLPNWSSTFGKSTSPQAFAFLTSLPVDF